jgi:branched-chain amino acid transport system ATP-binding protein
MFLSSSLAHCVALVTGVSCSLGGRGSGASILIAEQNMHFCLGIASDATVIDKGQIVYRDTIAGLKANEAIRARYLAI